MRFAERLGLGALVSSVVALVMGCAEPKYTPKPIEEPGPTAPIPAAKGRVVDPDAGLSPELRRDFDEALQAMRAGQTAQAVKAFVALSKANPRLAGPHANLGIMLRQAGKLAESASELERAVSLNPNRPVYFNELAITYRHMGLFERAQITYAKAIALDANYAAAVLNLGILYDLYLGNPVSAKAQYERYLAITPGGDATVSKWIAELKNRKPLASAEPPKDPS